MLTYVNLDIVSSDILVCYHLTFKIWDRTSMGKPCNFVFGKLLTNISLSEL